MNDIIAIRARAENATPSPWDIGEDQTEPYEYLHSLHIYALDKKDDLTEDDEWTKIAWCSCSQDGSQSGENSPKLKYARANANFIAHARSDVPALCDEVETLRADLLASTAREKRMREVLEFYARGTDANIQGPEAYLAITGASSTAVTKVPFGTLARQALKDTSNG